MTDPESDQAASGFFGKHIEPYVASNGGSNINRRFWTLYPTKVMTGKTIDERGHSKDHRPDLIQMVVSALLEDRGKLIACEMLSGNTADATSKLPVVTK